MCKITNALKFAGYGRMAPTEENLVNCYKLYVDAGIFHRNIKLEKVDEMISAGKITTDSIVHDLMQLDKV